MPWFQRNTNVGLEVLVWHHSLLQAADTLSKPSWPCHSSTCRTKYTSMRRFPRTGDANSDSPGFIYFVSSNLNGVTHHAHLPIFCLSLISTAMNKAPQRHNLSLCHSHAKKKDCTTPFRWSWGALSRLIFLSNPSFYVGSLLSPWRGNHILIRSILGLQFIFASPQPMCSSYGLCLAIWDS